MIRATLGFLILGVTALIVLISADSKAIPLDQRILIDAAARAPSLTVRPECTMGPPQIQKSDARRIA